MDRNSPANINLSQRSRKINSEEKLLNYILTQLGAPLITVDVTEEQILQNIDNTFDKFIDWAYDAQQHQIFIIETTEEIQDYMLDERVREIYDISIADTTTSYANYAGGGISLGGFGVLPINYVPYVDVEGNVSSLERGGGLGGGATGVAGGVTGPHTGGYSSGDKMNMAYAAMVDAQIAQNIFGQSISYDFNSQNHILRLFENVTGAVAIEAALEYIPNPDHDDAYGHIWIKDYALNLTKRTWSGNVGKFDQSLIGGANINYDKLFNEAQSELDRLEIDLLEKYSEPLGIFSA